MSLLHAKRYFVATHPAHGNADPHFPHVHQLVRQFHYHLCQPIETRYLPDELNLQWEDSVLRVFGLGCDDRSIFGRRQVYVCRQEHEASTGIQTEVVGCHYRKRLSYPGY